jgi:3-deoxy-D-manno-octulosonic-acid transferase
MGGSIAPVGGHNILEPAAAGASVVTGAHTSNFTAIVHAFLETDALIELPSVSERDAPRVVANQLKELLTDDERRRRMAARAREVLEKNRGATERTVKLLAKLLVASSGVREEESEQTQKSAPPPGRRALSS